MIVLTESEARAIYLALHRGAQLDGEDIAGLFLKTSGHQLLKDGELSLLLDKLACNRARVYPRYEMIFDGGKHYLPLWQAAVWYDCDWTKVEIGEWVVNGPVASEEDLAKMRRPLNDTDRFLIQDAADRHSESK